jgi:hypothetical protein
MESLVLPASPVDIILGSGLMNPVQIEVSTVNLAMLQKFTEFFPYSLQLSD